MQDDLNLMSHLFLCHRHCMLYVKKGIIDGAFYQIESIIPK